MAYPCNQFFEQEPWVNEPQKILDFVSDNFQVDFPMMEAVKVKKGKQQSELYKWLRMNDP